MPSIPELRSVIEDLAHAGPVRECFECFTRDKQWVNQRHLELCRIPAPTFQERRRAEWLLSQFQSLGCEARLDPPGNVLALLAPDRDSLQPLVALTAHLDTVLAPRRPEDIAVEPDGTLRGPGVSDNGAGLAALLAIARALRSAPLLADAPAALLLAATVGEEGEGNLTGMRHLVHDSPLAGRIRAYLVLEGPGADRIIHQALASRRFEVIFSGPGGHSWSDSGLANPIHALSRAITLLADQAPPPAPNGPRSSCHFGIVEGGSSVNSIPALARAKVDLRSEDEARLDHFEQLLAASVDRALQLENQRASGPNLTARIRRLGARPAGRLEDHSLLLAAMRAVDAHLGIRSRLECSSTDANVPLAAGRPAIAVGAGGAGGGMHSPSEWFNPDGRDLGLKRILLLLTWALRT